MLIGPAEQLRGIQKGPARASTKRAYRAGGPEFGTVELEAVMGRDELEQTAMPTEEDAELASLELVAPGDIVPPWRPLDVSGLLGVQDRRSVLAEVRVAVLDGATARSRERCRMLVGRARRLGRRVRAQLAEAPRAQVSIAPRSRSRLS